MITDDYRDIEAVYITNRNALAEEKRKAKEAESKQGLRRSYSSTTLLNLHRAREAVSRIMTECKSDEVLFDSVRVFVLDSRLRLNLAFLALEENEIRGAPVYDHSSGGYIGVLTFSDLVDALLLRHRAGNESSGAGDVMEYTIAKWRESCGQAPEDPATAFINVDDSLHEACSMLQERRLHRLPVYSRKAKLVVDLLTHARILHFIHNRIQHLWNQMNVPLVELFNASIQELNVGSYSDLITLSYSSTVATALELFSRKRLSCLPIVDESGHIVDIYNRMDVSRFCVTGFRADLEMNVRDAISKYRKRKVVLPTCAESATLQNVFDQFHASRAHRLYCVDGEGCLVGVVSLGDVFRCFL